jgi:hypothetical protein
MIPVAGTWGLQPDRESSAWWRGDSPWLQYMGGHGIRPLQPSDPYLWSTDLGHMAWQSGGQALEWYKALYGPEVPVRVVAHSHGLQVALYAAMLGLQIDTLISLSSPIRTDMELQVVDLARPNIRRWLHVRAKEFDLMDWGGSLFDGGGLDLHRHIPTKADLTDTVPGIAHSNVIYDPSWFYMWETLGWMELLRDWA